MAARSHCAAEIPSARRAPAAPSLSIILPVLNEADGLNDALAALDELRARGGQVIVVDGGSTDASVAIAAQHGIQVVHSECGRARQMNAGAALACGETLLFLHADTQLPPHADALVADALAASARCWGRFDVRVVGRSPAFPLISALMNLRSRVSGVATGDQAIFVTRTAFHALGGFPVLPLMEDVAMSRQLKRLSRPACIGAQVRTSGRRWERDGVWRTILLMWRLRWAYWRGASAAALAEKYR